MARSRRQLTGLLSLILITISAASAGGRTLARLRLTPSSSASLSDELDNAALMRGRSCPRNLPQTCKFWGARPLRAPQTKTSTVTPAQAGPYVGDPWMLAHILAGMQYVLGDLQADDSPTNPAQP